MQTSGPFALLLLALAASSLPATLAAAEGTNPLGKVLDLMDELAAKVKKDGEKEAAAYKEYFEWCDETSQNTNFEIKTATSKKGKLEAKISELSSAIEAGSSKIEDLVAAGSATAAELKNATSIRAGEASDFAAGEKELMEVVDTLERAIAILEREMQKSPAAFAQVDASSAQSLLQSLGAVVDAAGLSASSRQRLLALAQTQDAEDMEDQALGAPAAATYKSHSSGIVDTIEDMKEKAEGQLADLRKAEASGKHNFEMMKSSLEAQAAADAKDLAEEKAARAEAEEGKASAEGELATAEATLKGSTEALETAHRNCMQTAADHEATVKAREEELKVIAEATKILKDTASGAVGQTYSLLQQGSRSRSLATAQGARVLEAVRHLAQQQHSAALAQLASQVATALRFGASAGEDPFAKVKTLIQSLIERLESEAQAEATEKAFCDEEMGKTGTKKGELDDDISKLTVKIDQATARSAELKEEIKALETELAELAKSQAEMDKIRQESHADYVQAKADLELGLTGVRKALGVLRGYYAKEAAALLQDTANGQADSRQPAMPEKHEKSTGAGSSIIGILEVVESDFATNLAKEETEEADAATEYEKVTDENKIAKEVKSKDVEYKDKETKQLSQSLTELAADRDNAGTELSAVMEYLAKLKERCIAKPEAYEERVRRRTAEIAGLKDALATLESETAFVQRKRRVHVRGALVPH